MNKGTYNYRVRVGDVLHPYKVRCEITRDTGKAYYIKLLGFHYDGRRPGDTMIVHKRNVKLDEPAPPPDREVRLPYRDD